MREQLLDVFLHAFVVVIYGLVGAVATGAGLLFEYRSYTFASGGDLMLAVWIGGLGVLLLGLGYLVWSDKTRTAVGELRGTLRD